VSPGGRDPIRTGQTGPTRGEPDAGGHDGFHDGPQRAAAIRRPRSTTRDIQRYAALFAERTKVMRSSAMRDLMALTERDDVISLAGGLPDTSTFPSDSYAALMRTVASESCARALQYGPTEGFARVKRCITDVMGAEGMAIDPDEVLITTGGQQVIDLVCKTLLDPGDVVVAEAPTYPGAIPTFCAYQADVVQIAMDRDGMRVQDLEAKLDELEHAGRRPKFIYTVPNFHNPAGVTLSLERRRELVRIAGERELLVLEDNPYGLLRSRRSSRPGFAWAGPSRRRPSSTRCRSESRPRTCAHPRSRSTSSTPTSRPGRGTTTCARCWRSTGAAAT
jgi:2-aminoadipate transaminase